MNDRGGIRPLVVARKLLSEDPESRYSAEEQVRSLTLVLREDAVDLLNLLRDTAIPWDSVKDQAFKNIIGWLNFSSGKAREAYIADGTTLLSELASRIPENSDTWEEVMAALLTIGTRECVSEWLTAFLRSKRELPYAVSCSAMLDTVLFPEVLFPAILEAMNDSNKQRVVISIANQAFASKAITKSAFGREHIKPLEDLLADALTNRTAEDDIRTLSMAIDAIRGLGQIPCDESATILAAYLENRDVRVNLEAAAALVRIGRLEARSILRRACLSPITSRLGRRHFAELGLKRLTPRSSSDVLAMSSFSEWLAHPQEYGRYPQEIRIVDRQSLEWPSERGRTSAWIIAATFRSVGKESMTCGVVAKRVFSYPTLKMCERPPKHVYAIHCYLELVREGTIVEEEAPDQALVNRVFSALPPNARMVSPIVVAELSSKLRQTTLIGIASATVNGVSGWLVGDSKILKWYTKDDFQASTEGSTALAVHVGARILGLDLGIGKSLK